MDQYQAFCTYLNAFLTEIPNMGMKFHNFDIFYKICYIFDQSSALACRVESINTEHMDNDLIYHGIDLFPPYFCLFLLNVIQITKPKLDIARLICHHGHWFYIPCKRGVFFVTFFFNFYDMLYKLLNQNWTCLNSIECICFSLEFQNEHLAYYDDWFYILHVCNRGVFLCQIFIFYQMLYRILNHKLDIARLIWIHLSLVHGYRFYRPCKRGVFFVTYLSIFMTCYTNY